MGVTWYYLLMTSWVNYQIVSIKYVRNVIAVPEEDLNNTKDEEIPGVKLMPTPS